METSYQDKHQEGEIMKHQSRKSRDRGEMPLSPQLSPNTATALLHLSAAFVKWNYSLVKCLELQKSYYQRW